MRDLIECPKCKGEGAVRRQSAWWFVAMWLVLGAISWACVGAAMAMEAWASMVWAVVCAVVTPAIGLVGFYFEAQHD